MNSNFMFETLERDHVTGSPDETGWDIKVK